MRPATIIVLASTFLSLAGTPAWAADVDGPAIRHQPVVEATFGKPVTIRAKIEDQSGIFAPAVFVRARGERRYVSIPMKPTGDRFEATIPAELLAGDIEYFVEAFDEHGNGPSRRGAPNAPLRMRVSRGSQASSTKVLVPPSTATTEGPGPPGAAVVAESDEDGGVFNTWWFWTLVGVVAVGAAAGAAVALSSDPSVDAVSIEVRGPDPAGGPP